MSTYIPILIVWKIEKRKLFHLRNTEEAYKKASEVSGTCKILCEPIECSVLSAVICDENGI